MTDDEFMISAVSSAKAFEEMCSQELESTLTMAIMLRGAGVDLMVCCEAANRMASYFESLRSTLAEFDEKMKSA